MTRLADQADACCRLSWTTPSVAITAIFHPSLAQRHAQSTSLSENGNASASNPRLCSQAVRRIRSGLVKITSQMRQRMPPVVCQVELLGRIKFQLAERFWPSTNEGQSGKRIP